MTKIFNFLSFGKEEEEEEEKRVIEVSKISNFGKWKTGYLKENLYLHVKST